MTFANSSSYSMKFGLHEVLAGMLVTVEADRLTDDVKCLAMMFEGLASTIPLFATLAAASTPRQWPVPSRPLMTRRTFSTPAMST